MTPEERSDFARSLSVAVRDGTAEVWLNSWRDFLDAGLGSLPNPNLFVWRGQGNSNWPLKTSFDRAYDASPQLRDREDAFRSHLREFSFLTRGRRGPHPQPLDDLQMWSLGQHFGLATPLLDWSLSPAAALFFAFAEDKKFDCDGSPVTHRTVYGLIKLIPEWYDELHGTGRFEALGDDALRLYIPMTHENARLVNQSGLFTVVPIGMTIGGWLSRHFRDMREWPCLVKFNIPNENRLECLTFLNLMNVNYSSLFPDLTGASQHANMLLATLS